MAHVVTQSCVGDGSCVYSCPVNCIQPTPDDPAFELAEMLHIDPAACVDCGACVAACPVEAIKPHARLTEHERLFEAINAAYHRTPRQRPALAPVPRRLRVAARARALRVAIVGSGPAAMYAADELLAIPGARVTVYERNETPYGLVRSGIAPDHRRTRRISRQLDRIRLQPGLTMRLGVEVGTDVTHEELLEAKHAVIYAVGAATDRTLGIPGAGLRGVASATSFVGWYNGDPGHTGEEIDLSHRRAVVIGNGNVALDVARILTIDPEALADTEIAPAALAALRASQVEEVVVIGRRGPAQSAFTVPELVGLAATPGIDLIVPPGELSGTADGGPKADLLRGLEPSGGGRRIVLRYLRSPVEVHGEGRVESVELVRNELLEGSEPAIVPTADRETIEAGLLLTSIGYRGLAVPGLPFDARSGTVPNAGGRVIDPRAGAPRTGVYVTGWIRRGPTGFIGTNKACARETVEALVEDFNAGRLDSPRTAAGATPTSGRRLRALAGDRLGTRVTRSPDP